MFASFNPGHVGVRASLVEGLALAEKYGFGGYDAPLQQIHDAVEAEGADRLRERFLEHGLRVGAWNLPFMPYRVTEEEWKDWLTRLPPLLTSAAAIDARRACMWILPGCNEREFEDNVAFHIARFQPVARLLAEHGVRLGLEFVGPETSAAKFRFPFVRTLKPTLQLAHAIGGNCGLLLDCWHWHCTGGTREELAPLTRADLVHIHVNDAPAGIGRAELIDNQRKLPDTTGVIDLAGFMTALADTGYSGPVTAEPFDDEIRALPDEEATARTARATRRAVARANPTPPA